jgi:hypothetical protein
VVSCEGSLHIQPSLTRLSAFVSLGVLCDLLRRHVASASDGVGERKREIKVGGIGTRVSSLWSRSRSGRVGLGRVRLVPGLLERLIGLGLLRVARLACYGVVDLGPAVARLRWGGPWAEGQARGSRGIGWGGSMIGDDGCGAGGRPPDRR